MADAGEKNAEEGEGEARGATQTRNMSQEWNASDVMMLQDYSKNSYIK